MRERPIGDLVAGLRQLGADVDCFLGTNCPPVRVNGKGGLPGGKVMAALVLIRCCVSCSMYAYILILLYPPAPQLFSVILDAVYRSLESTSISFHDNLSEKY